MVRRPSFVLMAMGMRGMMTPALGLVLLASTAHAQVSWEVVADHVRYGRNDRALQALGEAEGAEARYLRGRLHERLGNLTAAADAWSELSGLPATVQNDARFRRGRALALRGECAEGTRLLSTLTEPLRTAQVARSLIAQCAAREASDESSREEAINLLNTAIMENGARVDTFALRMQRVELQLANGNRDAAVRELVALYVARPAHPEASSVRMVLESLGPMPTLSATQKMQRAERWMNQRRFRDAVRELEGTPPRAHRARWLHLRGMARYRSRGDYAEAAADLRLASRQRSTTAIDDEFHAARALSRADQDADAIRAYRRLTRRHRRHPRAAQAEYLAAWLEERLGRPAARRSFQRFLSRGRGTQTQRRNATWQLALHEYRRGSFRRAADLFANYADMGSGAMVTGRGLYWAGRASEKGRRTGRAADYYQRARGIDPLHWYGLLSDQRLRDLGVATPLPFGHAPPASEAISVSLPDDAAFFHRLGLASDALRALRRAERRLRQGAPAGRQIELLIAAYGRLDAARRSYQLGITRRGELAQQPRGAARWAWEAAYPRPAWHAVRRAADEQSIPWAHVYATMRQESGYAADAVSRADAIGLLQVLPSSGQRIARRLGVPFSRDRLFEPEQNVRIGAGEIAHAWRSFDGVQPLAIAAYNAGVARVRRWLSETGPMDLDLFVELIPFDETRNYVRRVTSHFARYRYLYEGERVTLPARVGIAPHEPPG
ncbi:MAG: transglycosylase SLT domain-containing protein [Myxococcota bacterium]